MNQIIDHFRQNRKDLISLILLILLIVAIPLTFVLAKQTQIFRPKASSGVFQVIQPQTGEVKYENSSQIETTTPTLDIELTSPIDNEGKQSDSGWIKTAYAEEGDEEYKLPFGDPPTTVIKRGNNVNEYVCKDNKIQEKHNCWFGWCSYREITDCSKVKDELGNVGECKQETENDDQITFCAGKRKSFTPVITSPAPGQEFDLSEFSTGFIKIEWDKIEQARGYGFQLFSSSGNLASVNLTNDTVRVVVEKLNSGFRVTSSKDSGSYIRHNDYSVPLASGEYKVKVFVLRPDGIYGQPAEVTFKILVPDQAPAKPDPSCEQLRRHSTTDESLKDKLLSGTTTKVKPSEVVGINHWIKDSKDGMKLEWEKNGGEFNGENVTGINWTAPDKPGDYTVTLKLGGQLQQSCIARFEVESAASAPETKKDSPAVAPKGPNTPAAPVTAPATATKKPTDDPKYCSGYYQRCGPKLEGTQWCEGGYTLNNGACGWSNAHPSYTTGCYKTKEDAKSNINEGLCNLPSGPKTDSGQGGAAPPVAIDYKSPGSLFGTKVVTLCGKDLTLDQLREELKGSGYDGLYDEVSATAAYLRTACPKSQNNCTSYPDTGDVPDDYVWVADCSVQGECLRNNSTGNDKNLCIDPKQNDPAACPKNYNDPYVNPATSNWCFGFANGNKCLMLWSKDYNENKKDVVAKGGGVPNAAMCPVGTTVGTPQPPAGNTGVGVTNPPAVQQSGNTGVGVTNPPVAPVETRVWEKASCTNGKFSGCTTVGGETCKDFGSNGRSGWSQDEYNKCKDACNAYGSSKNDAAACLALGANPPVVTKTISGKVEKQVKQGNSCAVEPMSRWVVSVYQGGLEREDTATDEEGKFSLKIPEDKLYAVRILNEDYYKNEKGETLTYKWDKRAYENQKQGSSNDCGSNCNFIRLEDGCNQPGAQTRLSETETQTLTSEYRVSQNRLDFNDQESLWQSYTQGGVRVQQTFSAPGQHFVFVQFRDQDKNIISPNGGDGIYILTVTYKLKDSAQPTNNPPVAGDDACTVPAQPTGLNYDSPSKTVSWGEVTGASVYHVRLVTPDGVQHNFGDIPRNWYTFAEDLVKPAGNYSWWVDAPSSCGVGRAASNFSVTSQPQPPTQQPGAGAATNQCVPEGNAEGLAPTSCSCNNDTDSSKRDYAGKCYTGTGQQEEVGGCNGGWCRGGVCATCGI